MPTIPSAAAFKRANLLNQSAQEAQAPGVVVIGGVPFVCAVDIGPSSPKLAPDGINFRNGRDANFEIAKSKLPVAPEPRSNVTINAEVFFIVDSGPENKNDTSWHITARQWA